MTREEAINLLSQFVKDGDGFLSDNTIEAFKMAIKALEQEPCVDAISREDAIDILLNEMECVQRASDEECNRDCAKCDLLRDTNKILQAYRIAIRALEHPELQKERELPKTPSDTPQVEVEPQESEDKNG